MNNLENFYNDFYKPEDGCDFGDLSTIQKKAIKDSLEFQRYELRIAINELRQSFIYEIDRISIKLESLLKNK